MSPALSVIIPTHRRSAILRQCLEHLRCQTMVKDIEVIVVSDGHDPDTAALFAGDEHTVFLEVPKSQQGSARNRGVAAAKGEIVLFIGDDIFLAPNACEQHLAAHKRTQCAVLGFTTWDPAVGITPVMRWLEESGWQFGYPMIRRYSGSFIPSSIQHRFTYTSHISLPTTLAKQLPFRTDITTYGWEDIEWGMKLKQAGAQLFYEPCATALHHHHIELVDSLSRMRTLGSSARTFKDTLPDRIPRGFKLLLQQIEAMLPTMKGRHRKAFLEGLHG